MPRQPWHRQLEETARAHEVFRVYLEEGTLEATTARCYPKSARKVSTTIAEWSAAHDWVERRNAYLAHLSNQFDQSAEQAAREEGYDFGKQKMANDIALSRTLSKVLIRIDEMADQPVTRQVVKVVSAWDETGKPIEIPQTVIEPARWTAGTIADLLKTAVLINREIVERAAGMADDADDMTEHLKSAEEIRAEIESKVVEFVPEARKG